MRSKYITGELPESLLEEDSEYHDRIRTMLKYQEDISNLKDLRKPVVPTTLIYSSFMDTKSAYVIKDKESENKLKRDDVLYFGGDGTVPTYSSVLAGLKWIYDNKKDSKYTILLYLYKVHENNIELVEYCSLLSKDEKFMFEEGKKKVFTSLRCECLNEEDEYNLEISSKIKDKCSHSTMINDHYMITYLRNIVLLLVLIKNQ